MTVRKKGNKWYCRFQLDGIRYERRCPLATDKLSAIQAEAVIKTEIMRGNLGYAKAIKTATIKDALKILQIHSETNKLSYKSDVIKIRKIKEFFGENTPLKDITLTDINCFKEYIRTKKVEEKIKVPNPNYKVNNCRKKYQIETITKEIELSNATINRYIELLSKMFNLCIDENLLEKNPCKNSGKLRQDNFKIRFLSKEEEKRMFEVINEEYSSLCPLIICALQTGMRKSEIFNLKWNQIDFKKGFIEILKSKSGKARKIPISKRLDEELRKLLVIKSNEYVFINPQTQKPYVDIKKSFSSILEKAEIENFRFHDLRHTVATRLVENGVDLVVVQEIMGHSNIQTTMRYAHPVPERKKQAISFLSSY